MASHSGGFQPLCSNQEMNMDPGPPKELSEFLKSAELPICVCVVNGHHLTSSVQITKGDVIFLKSCETKTVTLTHQDSNTGSRKQVNVPLDFPYKFSVLPPKTVSDRTASIIMYPSIADLIMDSPTYFEATTAYDDPYLPGFSIHRGDRFKFKGLVTDPKDGRERLKVFDELENTIFLSPDCRANFFPLEDEETYTLRQLIDFAPVPRRLRISMPQLQSDSAVSISSSEDSGFKDCISKNESERGSPLSREKLSDHEQSVSQLIKCSGVIHMLKPNLIINASPLNDTDTLWKIPITADLCVREHNLDDYEVPSVAKSRHILVPSPPPTPQTPSFPAPPTPPLPQPLVPVDVFHFSSIYGCPVKAKVMDTSQCDVSLQNLVNESEELSIFRVEKTKRVYAEDVKTGQVYSLANDLKISFIEYPQKFSEMSELLKLPLGSEITVLEDIASDFPRPFCLQFGDLLRVTTNTASSMRAKHTSIDCKILKCEKVNREGGSNAKMKLPLDFEVQMVLSTDQNSRRVISLNDIITGVEPIPSQEVATLIDNSEKSLQDLPVNLKLLKILPERLLVVTPYRIKTQTKSSSSESENVKEHDWPSPSHQSAPFRNIGISLTSGLVIAFRERLEVYEVDVLQAHANAIQVPIEVLTQSQYEERERVCKVWEEEEESEVQQSVVSGDRPSTMDASSQESATSSRQSEKNQKHKKKMDKIRRLSQVLNPKHWRPPKAAPEPLPHPSAIGLMALSMRPPSEQSNDYQIKDQEQPASQSSISSDEENNVYEDVEIGPMRSSISTPPPGKSESKGFFGPLHKSLPLKQIISRTYARNKAKKRGETLSNQPASSPIKESCNISLEEIENEVDEDPFYDAPELLNDSEQKQEAKTNARQGYNIPCNNLLKRVPTSAMAPGDVSSLPPLPPRRSSSTLKQEVTSIVTKHNSLDSLLDQSKSSSSTSNTSCKEKETLTQEKCFADPPVPPRRKKRVQSSSKPADSGDTDSISAVNVQPSPKLDDPKLENLHQNSQNYEDKSPLSKPRSNSAAESEKYAYSKVDFEKKKSQPQRMPVPKPRGLKRGKPPELPPDVDSSSHSEPVASSLADSVGEVHTENIDGKLGLKDRQRNTEDEKLQDLPVTEKAKTETPSCNKTSAKKSDSVKPKPPPKPKPRVNVSV